MTRDEFLDVMGEIDERLIDSSLDVSRMDTIYLPYKRRSALRYFIGAAACLAMVFAVAGVLRYFIGSPFFSAFVSGSSDPSDSGTSSPPTGSSSLSSSDGETSVPDYREPDYVRGWDPMNAKFDQTPDIGSTAIVSTTELDGIIVSLVLHNITKLPGTSYTKYGFDYTDYWGAEDIILYAENSDGSKVAEEAVTPHNGETKFLHKDCIFDGATRLYDIGGAYLAMQYIDRDARTGALIASFLQVDMNVGNSRLDEYGIANSGITAVNVTGIKRIGSWKYGYQASTDFAQTEGTAFADPVYGYEMNFIVNGGASVTYYDADTKIVTGFDPAALEYDPYPDIGETAVVSVGETDMIKAQLILYNVVKRPGEDNYLYPGEGWRDFWVAENIYLYITDDQGVRVLGELGTTLFTDSYKQLPGECLFEGCTRVYGTNDGHCLIMQYYDYDAESGEYSACFSSGVCTAPFAPVDENGVPVGELLFFEVSDENGPADVRFSKSFGYKEGTTFADTETGYAVTFDFDNNSARVAPLVRDPE